MWVFPGGRVFRRIARVWQRMTSSGRHGAPPCAKPKRRQASPSSSTRWFPCRLDVSPIAPTFPDLVFFLAEAPPSKVVIDGGEIHQQDWMQPADALCRRDSQEIELAPPTWVTLHELSSWNCVDEALAAARRRTPARFETHIVVAADDPVALWRPDAGWRDGDLAKPGRRHRLSMNEACWRYERSD